MTTQKNHFPRSAKVLLLAGIFLMICRFFLHYLEMGFFEFILFDLIFKWCLLLLPVIILVIRLINDKLTYRIIIDFVITGIIFCLVYYAMTPENLDRFDWKMNHAKRQEIARLAKDRKLKNISGTLYAIPSSLTLFPYIKSNDIVVNYQEDTTCTITFYTDRGLVDHYAAFIYSNNPDQIVKLDDKANQGGYNEKKEMNWYYVRF